MISWPRHLPENQVRGQLAIGCDWFPTIAELCQIELPKHRLDGRSLVPVIQSETAPSLHAEFHWMTGNQWVVRQGDWKLIGNPKDTSNKAPLTKEDRLFLVNLKDDIGESRNLAAENPDRVKALQAAHNDWANGLKP